MRRKGRVQLQVVTYITLFVFIVGIPAHAIVPDLGFLRDLGKLGETRAHKLFGVSEDDAKNDPGYQACLLPPEGHREPNNPNDPCNEADLLDKGAIAQADASVHYAIVATICMSECLASMVDGGATSLMINMCKYGGYAAMGLETLRSFEVGKEGQNGLSQMMSGFQFMQTSGMIGGGGSTAEVELANRAKEDGGEGKTDWGSCAAAAINGVQSGVRWANFKSSRDQARQARLAKLDMVANLPPTAQLNGPANNDESTNGTGIQAGQGMPGKTNRTVAKEEGIAQDNSQASEAQAIFTDPLSREFEKLTGGAGVDEVFKRAAEGTPPLLAATELAANSLGSQGVSNLAAINAAAEDINEEQLKELNDMDKKIGASAVAFEGVAGGRAKGGGGDSGMPDIHALMAGIMPKKGGAKKSREPGRLISFDKGRVAKANAQGIHEPTFSIFDIVGSRYRLLTQQFLSGQTVGDPGKKPASLLPANPYLRK